MNYFQYIHCNYRHLTDHWRNESHIVLHNEDFVWQIEVKKRKNKITLHNGWIPFITDMNLKVGDVCFFYMRECYTEFDVEVVRKYAVNI